ncbi:hypothetical protein N7510_001304 [Penicillium lagena]|uniref:uncharacterized protein n=1 Tax=Penicillium lagena TaxID=94218 RepID=UPI0025422123|nr:uncharacterized protein N7510_001304 [Penicillium lagena]KAJ5624995.1 hypothetical protein N7510_001304 [Penicillium lagena]
MELYERLHKYMRRDLDGRTVSMHRHEASAPEIDIALYANADMNQAHSIRALNGHNILLGKRIAKGLYDYTMAPSVLGVMDFMGRT